MNTTEEKALRWRGASVADRLLYMSEEMHVNYPSFVNALQEIRRHAIACEQRNRGDGLLLLVPTGAGKTYIRDYIEKLWPADHSGEQSRIPVVAFRLPSTISKWAIAATLLQTISPSLSTCHTESELNKRIKVLLPQLRTRVIIIDNVHDIPARRKDGGIKEIGDLLRDLIDDCKRLVVLLGAPSAVSLVRLSPQLRRRTAKQIHLDYFRIDSPRQFKTFHEFLQRYANALPLAETSDISVDLAKRLYYATNGIMDYVYRVFSWAVDIAVNDGREYITQSDLANALQVHFGAALKDELNPLLPGGVMRNLTQEGEPYEEWVDSWTMPLKPRKS
ncbi:TniB family NTP-binding protein [Pseudoduganella sp.]|uniref:TniB family NTP-binding protein n=1 Tax=Pseudoduganella sp. TaxID=1880898 RepID=UPI0035B400E6